MPNTTRFIETDDTTLAVRWFIPVASPPRENVELRWVRGQLVDVRPVPAAAVTDRTIAVLPALINSHTHLDLAHLKQPIGDGCDLPDWLPQVVASRSDTPDRSVRDGLRQSFEAGVAIVADVSGQPAEASHPGVDRIVFREYLGLADWEAKSIAAADAVSQGLHLSPHATYSVPLPALSRLVRLAGSAPIMMHFAEHAAERTLLNYGTGPFRAMLERLGVWRDDVYPPGVDGYRLTLRTLLDASRPILVHGNHLDSDDIALLAEHGRASVVWCPRTHAHFRQPRHPVRELLDNGVPVAIGTDSTASSATLDPWDDVCHAYRTRADITPTELLRMVTTTAASILDRGGSGTLAIGSPAPAIAIPLAEPDATEWSIALLGSR